MAEEKAQTLLEVLSLMEGTDTDKDWKHRKCKDNEVPPVGWGCPLKQDDGCQVLQIRKPQVGDTGPGQRERPKVDREGPCRPPGQRVPKWCAWEMLRRVCRSLPGTGQCSDRVGGPHMPCERWWGLSAQPGPPGQGSASLRLPWAGPGLPAQTSRLPHLPPA